MVVTLLFAGEEDHYVVVLNWFFKHAYNEGLHRFLKEVIIISIDKTDPKDLKWREYYWGYTHKTSSTKS